MSDDVTDEDIAELATKAVAGDFGQLQAGASKVAIGVRLAENIGARVGDTITIINPQGRSTRSVWASADFSEWLNDTQLVADGQTLGLVTKVDPKYLPALGG